MLTPIRYEEVPTFLVAGHETTRFLCFAVQLSIYLPMVLSTAVVWALYALVRHPAACAKLKAEARAFYTDTPSMDELNGMTYLDYVTREVLRLHAPVPFTDRVAKTDVVIPVSQPFTDRHGVKRHEFRQVNPHLCALAAF
jgi:cytochrome P450